MQPVLQVVEAGRIERLDARLALGAGGDEPGLAQDVQVLRNGRRTQVEFLDELAGGMLALGEQLDDAPAGRISNGGKTLHAG